MPLLAALTQTNTNGYSCLLFVRLQVENFKIENLELAPTYSPFKESTIGDGGLNFRVRNENGCTPTSKAPTQDFQYSIFKFHYGAGFRVCHVVSSALLLWFGMRTSVSYRDCTPFAYFLQNISKGLATVHWTVSPLPLNHQL